MPSGSHTAVLVMVTGVPRLRAAADRWRWAEYSVQVALEREGACPRLASWETMWATEAAGAWGQSDTGLWSCFLISNSGLKAQFEIWFCHLSVVWPPPMILSKGTQPLSVRRLTEVIFYSFINLLSPSWNSRASSTGSAQLMGGPLQGWCPLMVRGRGSELWWHWVPPELWGGLVPQNWNAITFALWWWWSNVINSKVCFLFVCLFLHFNSSEIEIYLSFTVSRWQLRCFCQCLCTDGQLASIKARIKGFGCLGKSPGDTVKRYSTYTVDF